MTLPILRVPGDQVPGDQAPIHQAIFHKGRTLDTGLSDRCRAIGASPPNAKTWPCPTGFFAMLGRGGGLLVLGLLLISCEQASQPTQSTQATQQPLARRRAVQPSQRREARMARPVSPAEQPRADYAPYKQIQPEMMLAEVQAILGSPGQYYELQASAAEGVEAERLSEGHSRGMASESYVAEKTDAEVLFWRWTHPSQAYNIHLRLEARAESGELVVQAKWLTYNPPGPSTLADARNQD